jgi:hypothetical protein
MTPHYVIHHRVKAGVHVCRLLLPLLRHACHALHAQSGPAGCRARAADLQSSGDIYQPPRTTQLCQTVFLMQPHLGCTAAGRQTRLGCWRELTACTKQRNSTSSVSQRPASQCCQHLVPDDKKEGVQVAGEPSPCFKSLVPSQLPDIMSLT